ncbi:MAG: LysM peptidoglycan-binding domain-containing protein [Verrucomicrobiota bacterium]|jgi:LysM repeat protein
MERLRSVLPFLSLACTLTFVGCDGDTSSAMRTPELEDSEFRQGMTYEKQREPRKALESFLKVIDARKGASESHLEAGRMYLDLQDPLPAIYHFNQYLRLKPNSEQSPIVRQMVKTAEKMFTQQLPGRPLEPSAGGSVDQSAQIRKLQNENTKLMLEVSELSRGVRNPEPKNDPRTPGVAAIPDKGTPAVPGVAPANGRKAPAFTTYVIVAGDTLSKISSKAYGTPTRANDIYNANRDKISSPASLKPGTTLTIPQ